MKLKSERDASDLGWITAKSHPKFVTYSRVVQWESAEPHGKLIARRLLQSSLGSGAPQLGLQLPKLISLGASY